MSQEMNKVADNDSVQQTKETVSQVQDSGFDVGIIGILLIVSSIIVIGCIIFFVSSKKDDEKTKEKSETKDTEENSWHMTWEDMKDQLVLPHTLEQDIESLEQKISSLLPLLQQEKWNDEMHEMIRMKEEELPLLLNRFATLTEPERVEETKRLENTIHTMKNEVVHIEQMLQNVKRTEYEQTVRVIETRYKKRKQKA